MAGNAPDEPERGDTYRHDDGTVETVFAVVEGRILTVREYPSRAAFGDAVGVATYTGTNEEVEDLEEIHEFDGE